MGVQTNSTISCHTGPETRSPMNPRLKLFSRLGSQSTTIAADGSVSIRPLEILTKVEIVVLCGLLPVRNNGTTAVHDGLQNPSTNRYHIPRSNSAEAMASAREALEEMRHVALVNIRSPDEKLLAAVSQRIPPRDLSRIMVASSDPVPLKASEDYQRCTPYTHKTVFCQSAPPSRYSPNSPSLYPPPPSSFSPIDPPSLYSPPPSSFSPPESPSLYPPPPSSFSPPESPSPYSPPPSSSSPPESPSLYPPPPSSFSPPDSPSFYSPSESQLVEIRLKTRPVSQMQSSSYRINRTQSFGVPVHTLPGSSFTLPRKTAATTRAVSCTAPEGRETQTLPRNGTTNLQRSSLAPQTIHSKPDPKLFLARKPGDRSPKVFLAQKLGGRSIKVPFPPDELIKLAIYFQGLKQPKAVENNERFEYHTAEALQYEKAAVAAWKRIAPARYYALKPLRTFNEIAKAQECLPYIPEVLRWLIHRSASTFYTGFHAWKARHFHVLRSWFTYFRTKKEHLAWIPEFLDSPVYNLLFERLRNAESSPNGIFLSEKIQEALLPKNIDPLLKIPPGVDFKRWSRKYVAGKSALGLERTTEAHVASIAEVYYYLGAFCRAAGLFYELGYSKRYEEEVLIRAIQLLYTVDRCCIPNNPHLKECLKATYEYMNVNYPQRSNNSKCFCL